MKTLRFFGLMSALCLLMACTSEEETPQGGGNNKPPPHVSVPDNGQKIALVIGNSDYKEKPLKNPVNDAHAMTAKLRALGFEVLERTNLKKSEMGATLTAFNNKLTPGAVALIFYAGHGVQMKDGTNYLPAVDAEIKNAFDVPAQSLSVKQMMEMLETAKTRLNLVFLDACRDNPYSDRSFRSGQRGLARVEAPEGTLISYATKPGSVAADGNGNNGLYTSKLLTQMDSSLPIEMALKRVVSEVKKESGGEQIPWMEGSIEGEFCFAGCTVVDNTTPPASPVAVINPEANRLAAIQRAKDQLNASDQTKWQIAVHQLENKTLAPLDHEAMHLLAASYEGGVLGIKASRVKACTWYQKSAQSGNTSAQKRLTELYATGICQK